MSTTSTSDVAGPETSGVLGGDDLAGRVVRGGALRFVGFGVINVLGAAGSVVLLHHLSVSDFGRYGTVIALIGIVSGIADAGLNITGSRELSLLPKGPERRRLLGAVLGVRLLLSTAAVAIAIAFAVIVGYDDVMLLGTALAGFGAILIGTQTTLTLPLVVELKNGLLTLSEIIRQAAFMAGIVILVVADARLTPFFALQIVMGLAALATIPFIVERAQLAWPTVSRADWRRLAVTALPVALASVLTALYIRILTVIASLQTSEYETGLFVTSARIIEMVGGLAMLIMGVILPVATVAARDDRDRLRYVLISTTKLSLLIGGLLALIVVVAARPIVVLLGGEEFAPAASILRIQAPAIVTIFLIYPWTAFMIADGRRRQLVRCMLIGLSVVMIGGIALVAMLDAEGAALAAVAADVVLGAAMVLAVRRGVGDGTWPIDGSYLTRFAGAAAVAGGAAALVAMPLPSAAAAAIAAVVFAAAAFALRLVPSEVLDLLPGRRAA